MDDWRGWRTPQRFIHEQLSRRWLVVIIFQSINGNTLSLGLRLLFRIYTVRFLVSTLPF